MVLKSTIFKHFYFELTEVISDALISGSVRYESKSKQYFSTPLFEKIWVEKLDELMKDSMNLFSIDAQLAQNYVWFFKRILPVNQSILVNLLHHFIFNPYAMSPVIMMYMVSKTALLEFKRNGDYSLDKVFADHLTKYNSLLDHPLSEKIIGSMKKKFYEDDNSIKTDTMKWFSGYRRFQNLGFVWLNNDRDIVLNDYEAKVYLSATIGQFSFTNKEALERAYKLCSVGKKTSNSSFRLATLNLYLAHAVKLNEQYNLSFYGVGVIPLMVQALFDSIALEGSRIAIKNILNRDQLNIELSEREMLLDVNEDYALFSRSSLINIERLDVIGNHDLILSLVNTAQG